MLKIEIHKKKVMLIAAAAAALFFLALFIYLPLLKEVKRKGAQWNGLKGQLEAARLNAEILLTSGVSKKLIAQSEVTSAIDAISKAGRSLFLNFRYLSQEEIRSENGYAILPLRMEVEGEYGQLGAFFGALENIKDIIVAVKDMQIKRSDNTLPKLSAVLTLYIYLK